MTSEQLVSYKDHRGEAKCVAERWAPKIVKWRRGVSGSDAAARGKALDEIRAIVEIDSILLIERIICMRRARSASCRRMPANRARFSGSSRRCRAQPATKSLTRIAVFAPDATERASAVKKLKPRDQHDFVPLLLGALGMPIESSYSLTTGPDGSVHYLRSLYREGPESDLAWDSRIQQSNRISAISQCDSTVTPTLGKTAQRQRGRFMRR